MSSQTSPRSVVDWGSQLLAYTFAMHFLFGTAAVLNEAGLSFFFYYPRKIDIVFVGPNVDVLVWVVSIVCLSVLAIWFSSGRRRIVEVCLALPAMVLGIVLLISGDGILGVTGVGVLFAVGTAEFVTLIVGSRSYAGSTQGLVSKLLIYLLGTLAVIESSSAVHYVLLSFDPATTIGGVDAGIELQLSYAPYALIPLLYVGFLFSWAWVPLVRRFLPWNLLPRNPDIPSNDQTPLARSSVRKRFEALLDPRILLVFAFAVFIGYYPYFQNPPWLVGTDAIWRYYSPLLRMNAHGVFGGFLEALSEFHPFLLALLYGVQLIFGATAFEVVRLTPLFLVVALGCATWWFIARKKSLSLGLVVFALSVLSVTTTVGFYASILANWMTLLVWVVFFAYVAYRGDEGFRVVDVIVLLALSTLILFIHPWTWGVFAATVFVAAILALFQERRRGLRGAGILVSVIVIDVVAALLGLTLLRGGIGSGFASALQLYDFPVCKSVDSIVFLGFFDLPDSGLGTVLQPAVSRHEHLGRLRYLLHEPLALASATRLRLDLCIGDWVCARGSGRLQSCTAKRGPNRIVAASISNPVPARSALRNYLAGSTSSPIPDTRRAVNLRVGGAVGGVHLIWLFAVFVIGALLAWTPAGNVWLRFSLLFLLLPAVTAVLLRKSGDRADSEFLRAIIFAIFLLVAFNSTTRAVSQLLRDPHNCDQC